MTKRKLIDMFKNKIFPKQAEDLLKMNYEGLGELDKREFLRDTSILIMLAEKGLKSEQEPTTKNNLGVDCIDRNRAIERLKLNFPISEGADGSRDRHRYMQTLADLQVIRELPSVTPQEPRKGHWIEHEESISTASKHLRECSCCKCYFDWLMPRNSFCPNCGADMREGEK